MKKEIRGLVYVLGDDVDTDQIIPAEHLVYSLEDPKERLMYARHALSSVPDGKAGLPDGDIRFVEPDQEKSKYTIIIAGKNFGCGSSREHAPFALRESGIGAIVAEFYARIFFRNCVNGGYLIPCESPQRLVEKFKTGEEAMIKLPENTITNLSTGEKFPLSPLGSVLDILEAGNVFEYARSIGMLPS